MIFPQELLEVFPTLRPCSLFGLRNCSNAGEILVDLPVEFLPIRDDNECPVPPHLAQDLLRKKHHGEAFAAPLCVPEDAEPSLVLPDLVRGFDRPVYAEVLVV